VYQQRVIVREDAAADRSSQLAMKTAEDVDLWAYGRFSLLKSTGLFVPKSAIES
jgi:hypothetical protein